MPQSPGSFIQGCQLLATPVTPLTSLKWKSGLILGLRPANERRRLSLAGSKPRISPENVIILMEISSLTAPEVIILIISCVASDENFMKMIFCFSDSLCSWTLIKLLFQLASVTTRVPAAISDIYLTWQTTSALQWFYVLTHFIHSWVFFRFFRTSTMFCIHCHPVFSVYDPQNLLPQCIALWYLWLQIFSIMWFSNILQHLSES